MVSRMKLVKRNCEALSGEFVGDKEQYARARTTVHRGLIRKIGFRFFVCTHNLKLHSPCSA